MDERPTTNASELPSRPTAESRTCWGSGSSACGGCQGASRLEARVHGAEPAAHGGPQHGLSGGKAPVRLAGASLAEGGWWVRSNMLEHPHGGGSGDACVRPQARRRRLQAEQVLALLGRRQSPSLLPTPPAALPPPSGLGFRTATALALCSAWPSSGHRASGSGRCGPAPARTFAA